MSDKAQTGATSAPTTRRGFLAGSAGAALLASGNFAHGQASGTIRVGLIGCGGRGTGASDDCTKSSQGVELWAMGDLFRDRLDNCRKQLVNLGPRNKVTDDRCFVGWDAARQVIDSGVDMVILATPPAFRPMHFKMAVDAGKHVFCEKPVAVDAPGVRSFIATAELAKTKGLGVVAGTQRRHQARYLDIIKRIHDGAIGDVVAGYVYWNQGGLWHRGNKPEWSPMEYQNRNWYYFTWLSGDHIVEQHIHQLDVMNWVLKAHPTKVTGSGGRQQRTEAQWGHIFDHFALEYEFESGARITSFCRQQDGTAARVAEHFIGTKGSSDPARTIRGAVTYRWDGQETNPYVQEHADLIASIRAGKPLNEGRQVAESSLTAIMGRMAAYTGIEITWEMAMNSKESLLPEKLEWGPIATPPVPIPGKTKFI